MALHEPIPDPLPADEQANSAYVGTELPLFAKAVRWKSYFGNLLCPYVSGDVLEVGAGFGGTTPFIGNGDVRSWTALEPDSQLASQIPAFVREAGSTFVPEVLVGTLVDLPAQASFDCITYIDVLEHIEHDAAELARAASHLRPGGHLVVLSPAYPWLFSEFDRAVGHFRRYTARSLRSTGPAGLTPLKFFYLDAVGVAASFANRLMLKQSSPTIQQVAFWDSRIIPVSVFVDPLLLRSFGRSVVGVWKMR
jgi:SAM-dependent methyltransferase